MHIAFVTPESPYGDESVCGVAAYLRAIVPAVADAGHRITVFANAKEEKLFTVEDGRVSVRHVPLPSKHWYAAKVPGLRSIAPLPTRQIEWSWSFYREVVAASAQDPIDVIESTETGSLFLHRIAPVVIRLHGSERTFREHSGLPVNASVRLNDRIEAIAADRATAITAPSQAHANGIAQRRRWPADRIRVIPNPISAAVLKAAAGFKRNGNSEKVVLYAGRLAPVKGIDRLLEAAKRVRATDPSITFVLAGPWQMSRSPEDYGLRLNGAANGIRWIGPQDQREIIGWYSRASLLVMPSNYESFGISALEAMAFGLPIVATEQAVLGQPLVLNGEVLTVPTNDAAALAEGITRVLIASEPRNKSKETYQRILELCSPARVAADTLKLYEQIVGRSN